MYLDHTFGLRLSLSEITSLFGLSMYLIRPNFRPANWLSES